MFDPRRLIHEVQLRPCLWDMKNKNYINRSMRRIAWDQIAEELNLDWNKYTATNKKETVNDIQSKWKHIRDYYLRENKKNTPFDYHPASKNRVPQYFEMLGFLEVTADHRPKDSKLDIDKPNDTNSTNDLSNLDINSFFLLPSQTTSPPPSCDDVLESFQTSLLNNFTYKENTDEDPERSFLLSLLPEIQTMTAKEKFEFKFEVLSAIKRIKYDPQHSTVDGNNFCPEPISSTEFGCVDGKLTFSLH